MTKLFFGGLDLLRPEVIEPTKMPRSAAIPVVRDPATGYLNAATYSAGVFSLDPLCVIFGPKGGQAIDTFRESNEFTVAVPRREQIDHMWVTALEIPHGISEIDVAGWHELPGRAVTTPGIAECPLNLECRVIFCRSLPPPWRTIVIGQVLGVSIDRHLLELPRSQVVTLYPMHEAGSHPDTGLYGPSVMSGELILSEPSPGQGTFAAEPSPRSSPRSIGCRGEGRVRGDSGIPGLPPSPQPSPYEGEGAGNKVYVSAADLYRPENDAVLMNAVWPRPSYILLTGSGERLHALPLSGGSLQSTEPAVQVPIPRDSDCYRDIKASGEFVIAVPDRACIGLYERLQHSASYDLAAAGFTLLPPNMIATPGLEQCRVNMDCRSVMLEDVPGTDFAILVGRRIGVTLNPDDVAHLDPAQHSLHDRLAYVNSLYASFMYSVLDRGGQRAWGFHDPNDLSVRPLPSWGSRYTGGWWGPGPALNYWMIELCQSGLLTKPDYYKIMHWLRLWNNGALIPHLAEFIDEPMKQELRQRLTILFHMMAWAHRDLAAWQAVRDYLAQFADPPRDHHSGPIYHHNWYHHNWYGAEL